MINFAIYERSIFRRPGIFGRFIQAHLAMWALVSSLPPTFRYLIDTSFAAPWRDRTGFLLAALLSPVPSYFVKQVWVFGIQSWP